MSPDQDLIAAWARVPPDAIVGIVPETAEVDATDRGEQNLANSIVLRLGRYGRHRFMAGLAVGFLLLCAANAATGPVLDSEEFVGRGRRVLLAALDEFIHPAAWSPPNNLESCDHRHLRPL